MDSSNITKILTLTVDKLSENESCKELFHQYKEGEPLLSAQALNDIIELARAILFPGYYGNPTADEQAIHHHIEVNVETLFNLLIEQILLQSISPKMNRATNLKSLNTKRQAYQQQSSSVNYPI